MSDNYCRVYDKEALRMLVVENELEERARIKKQNSLQAKKSGSKSVSAKRSSLVASESEKQLREKERADVRYQRFKYAQKIREKKEKLEKKSAWKQQPKEKRTYSDTGTGGSTTLKKKHRCRRCTSGWTRIKRKRRQNCASCMKRGIKIYTAVYQNMLMKSWKHVIMPSTGDSKKRVPKIMLI